MNLEIKFSSILKESLFQLENDIFLRSHLSFNTEQFFFLSTMQISIVYLVSQKKI